MLTLLDGEAQPEHDVVRVNFLVYLPKSVYRYSALAFQPGAISVSQPAPTVLPTRVSFQLTAVLAVPGEMVQEPEEPRRTEAPGIRKRSADFFERDAARNVQQTPGRDENAQTGGIEESDFCLTEPENWSVRKKLLLRRTAAA